MRLEKKIGKLRPQRLSENGNNEIKSTYSDEIPQCIVEFAELINMEISLTESIHVFIFDTEWCLREELQATLRVYRIGYIKYAPRLSGLSPIDRQCRLVTMRTSLACEHWDEQDWL